MIEPTWYPTKKQLRQFAVVAPFGFGLVGALAHWKFGWEIASYVLWGMGGFTFLIGLARPRAVFPIYGLLMLITLPIGLLLSAVVIRVLFYGIMMPLGLFFRLIGRDPLRLRKPDTDSFWQKYEKRNDLASYYRQT